MGEATLTSFMQVTYRGEDETTRVVVVAEPFSSNEAVSGYPATPNNGGEWDPDDFFTVDTWRVLSTTMVEAFFRADDVVRPPAFNWLWVEKRSYDS
jgi:hypothetical protein